MAIKSRPLSLTMRVVLFVAVTVIACLTLVATLINSSIKHHFFKQDSSELHVINQSIELVLIDFKAKLQHNSAALSKLAKRGSDVKPLLYL